MLGEAPTNLFNRKRLGFVEHVILNPIWDGALQISLEQFVLNDSQFPHSSLVLGIGQLNHKLTVAGEYVLDKFGPLYS
jgi:hypothetical protein